MSIIYNNLNIYSDDEKQDQINPQHIVLIVQIGYVLAAFYEKQDLDLAATYSPRDQRPKYHRLSVSGAVCQGNGVVDNI